MFITFYIGFIFSVYYTGDLSDNFELSISCPSNWSYYIYIVSAYYGNPSHSSLGSVVCQDSSATSKVNGWCHTKTECTYTYSIAGFGVDPCLYTTISYYRTYQQHSTTQYIYDPLYFTYTAYTTYYSLSVQNSLTHYHTRTKYGQLEYHCASKL